MNIKEARSWAIKELSLSPSPRLDSDVILKNILGVEEDFILFHGEKELSKEQETSFLSGIQKRKQGLPVAYITGKKEFFGYDFSVTPSVLIPKPDTETLVENSLRLILEKISDISSFETLSICDMCTGSGCVLISILKTLEERNSESLSLISPLVFSDISDSSLEIASLNASNLLSPSLFSKISFVKSDLFSSFTSEDQKSFDLIISNPPYIPLLETQELLKDGRSEPFIALCGDIDSNGKVTEKNDGLEIIRRLIFQSKSFLKRNGVLIFETGEYNAKEASCIMEENGFSSVEIFSDIEGRPRNVSGKLI